MNSEKLPQLDSIIHSRIRLAVISLLTSVRQADFNYLKNTIGTTDGNLSTHLTKLEEAGYISVKKSFKEKKPHSLYSITEKGKDCFSRYLKALEEIIHLENQ